MNYYGFTTRDYLIFDNIKEIVSKASVLEIGVGLGSFIKLINGMIKNFSGVDISKEISDHLSFLYSNRNDINFYCLDVCQKDSNLGKLFDIIVSADTLEHVANPQAFFNFIKKHLIFGGRVVLTFPNESKEKHHGIVWFEDKEKLLSTIKKSGLYVEKLLEVRETMWHKAIKFIFWKMPKLLFLRKNKNPQTFEETMAYEIVSSSNNFKKNILSFYANITTKLSKAFPLYKYFFLDKGIKNKRLLLILKNQ